MAKRSHSSPSLFPFLSVLVAMIGAMILIALAVLTISLGKAQSNIRIEANQDSNDITSMLSPIFIECFSNRAFNWNTNETYLLEKGQTLFEGTKSIPDSQFLLFLQKVDCSKEYVLLYVRPKGIETYRTIFDGIKLLQQRNKFVKLRVGYELVPEEWKIDFARAIRELCPKNYQVRKENNI